MHFSLSFILIWILINHLLGFIYPRCSNFELNNVRIPKIKVIWSSGIGTTLVGTSTNPVLHVITGATLSWYRYHFSSGEWYRYHFTLVPVPFGLCKVVPVPPLFWYRYHFTGLPRNGRICHFDTNFSSLNLFNALLHQNPPWNPSKTTPQTLIMVV